MGVLEYWGDAKTKRLGLNRFPGPQDLQASDPKAGPLSVKRQIISLAIALLLLGAHKCKLPRCRLTQMKNGVNEISQEISLCVIPFQKYPVDIRVGPCRLFDFQKDVTRWKVF